MSAPLRVLLAGGGTAGHVQPLLALADALRVRRPDAQVLVLGTRAGLEHRLVPERGYDLAEVDRVPLPRRPGADLLALPARLARAVAQAGRAIDAVGEPAGRADVVVGFGGYVATPAYLAAARRRVPMVVHEQNFRPGVANRVGAALGARVALTFAGTALRPRRGSATVTGMPLRSTLAGLDRGALREEALEHFGLAAGPATLLVTGGSLGAARLNAAMAASAEHLVAAGVQVLHLTGRGKADGLDEVSASPRYRVLEYTDRMDLAYAAADLAVCRSGAGTVCELSAVGLPALYVPLPHGNGEQRLNAAPLVAAGGGLLVDDADFDAEVVRTTVTGLLTDPERMHAMAGAAADAGARDGASSLVDVVLAAAGRAQESSP